MISAAIRCATDILSAFAILFMVSRDGAMLRCLDALDIKTQHSDVSAAEADGRR
jgi:hypothetical protein